MHRLASQSIPFLLIAALSAGGCGDSRRQRVEGTVTFDGQPIADGYICLTPMEGTPGPTAGGPIVDGRFTIAAEKGPFAGKFRAEVTASRPGKRMVFDPETGQNVAAREQFIPAKYNSQSELTVTLAAGKSEPVELALTSK